MNWIVRPLEIKDRSKWQSLWHAYVEFYGRTKDPIQTDKLWERLMQERSGILGLTACDRDDNSVGIAHYFFHPTTLSTIDKCYMQDLYVSPYQRSGGVGHALIEAVAEKAAAAGAEELYWMTQEHNSIARGLYDKVGELTPFIKYRRRLGA